MNKMERFTQQAQDVLVQTQRECEALHHRDIGTPHLLLGMTQERSGVAYRVLHEFGVGHDRVLSEVRKLSLDEQASDAVPELALELKRVLEASVEQARKMGRHYVGTEHMLLGMMERPDKVMKQLLERLELSVNAVRKQTVQTLQFHSENPTDQSYKKRFMFHPEHHRVLTLLEQAKITASEATELLKAMRIVSLPSPFSGAEYNPGSVFANAEILNRQVRVVLRNRSTGVVQLETSLPLDQFQRELALIYRALIQNQTAKLVEWPTGDDVVEVFID